MAWLCRDDEVLASLEVASGRRARRRGLLGRDSFDGALLLQPCRSVHTVGMRFPIDVAHLDHEGVVLRVCTMPRNRIGLPVRGSARVLEAEAGRFRHWELAPGQVLEVEDRSSQNRS